MLALVAMIWWSSGPGSFSFPKRDSSLEELRAATVMIEANGPTGRSVGSGFVVAEGTIATAAHVIQAAWMGRITLPSGRVLAIEGVRAVVPELDLAILAVPEVAIHPVRLGDPGAVKVGQRLFAVGCPMGLAV